jgi:hypothetical protein
MAAAKTYWMAIAKIFELVTIYSARPCCFKNPPSHYLDRVEHLPPAPLVAVQMLGLLNNPDRNIT